MNCKWSRVFAMMLAICLPVLSCAESNTSDIERAVTRRVSVKMPYQRIWELVDADDGEGLRTYLSAHKDTLTENDFMVVWFSDRGYSSGHTGEHIYCYAGRANKIKAGKVLIDLKYIPEKCFNNEDWGDLERTGRMYINRYKPSGAQFMHHMEPWSWRNYKLTCYALETQQMGFKGESYRLWPAAKGGCDEAFVLYRNDQLRFPTDYEYLTAPGWLALAEMRPELVATNDFQKNLMKRIASEKDSWFEREQMMKLVHPNPPVAPTYSHIEMVEFAINQIAQKNPTPFCQQAVSILKTHSQQKYQEKDYTGLMSVLEELYNNYNWANDGQISAADRKCYNGLHQILQQEDKIKAERDARRAQEEQRAREEAARLKAEEEARIAQEAQQAKEAAWQAKMLEVFNGDEQLIAKMDKQLRAAYYKNFRSGDEDPSAAADFIFFSDGVRIKEDQFLGPVVVGYVTEKHSPYEVTIFTIGGSRKVLRITGEVKVTGLSEEKHGFSFECRQVSKF